jgi:hypothetical protein
MGAASGATCTAADFGAIVDQSGASLRDLTLAEQPKLQARLRKYKAAKKLSDDAYENVALDAIRDKKLDELDKKSSDLLLRLDSLGRVPDGVQPDCAKLEEVKAASAELTSIIKQKSEYMLRRLDEKIAEAEGTPAAPKAGSPARTVEASPKPAPAKRPAVTQAAPKPQPVTPGWSADTKPNDAYSGPNVAMREGGRVPGLPPPQEDGYTIDEIRDATRGFFGTVSTNLAAVIEHTFKEMGRPTAYVLGTEGGGAFLAGLRFGKGKLYMRSERGVRDVYWHGPSVGTDLGASGSRTLFLIYRMHGTEDLYRTFTGIDGSAYFVGGVGLTLLKGGPVIMAPIRSGVGMRLGANLGYVRFTPQATWNPF